MTEIPSDNPGPSPQDETAPVGTTDTGQRRKVYKAIRNDQLLLPIPVPPGAVVVPKWDKANEVPGWVLTAAELEMHHQSLLWGQAMYVRESDGRQVRVGVRWNPQQFGLEADCLELEEPVPLKDTDGIDTDALEVSTLKRAQKMVELNSFIGTAVANPAAQKVMLEASGLGLELLRDPENWTVAEPEEQPGRDGDV